MVHHELLFGDLLIVQLLENRFDRTFQLLVHLNEAQIFEIVSSIRFLLHGLFQNQPLLQRPQLLELLTSLSFPNFFDRHFVFEFLFLQGQRFL